MPEESYSNPLAPPDHQDDGGNSKISAADRHPLTNADFRKLLQTPRVTSSSSSGGGSQQKPNNETPSSFSHHRNAGAVPGPNESSGKKPIKKGGGGAAAAGQKKGNFQKKGEDEDELSEIMKKYRDRARERRVGEVQETQQEIDLIQSSGYRAVAPDIKANLDLAEKRKRIIEESKYLGGDMEHTHLVKGLDYALLQKVRSEILSKEKDEDTMEETYQARKTERDEVESQLKSALSRNIYSILFKNEHPPINELFAPRRMAYVIELDDEYAETDIPTTLIRSKQDCPVDETSTNLSINDMVIQKLTQVLSYLRTDTKKKRKGKEKIPETERVKIASQNIYDDTGDYIPTVNRSSTNVYNKSESSNKNSSRNYFDKPSTVDEQEKRYDKKSSSRNTAADNRYDNEHTNRRDKERDSRGGEHRGDNRDSSSSYQQKHSRSSDNKINNNNNQKQREDVQQQKSSTSGKRAATLNDLGSYAECYPGGYECYDAAGDSDDDADFSKMDLGNRKGPIRRWDFETEQEYEEYMSRREALPKAAFQYGVKMNDGRKTRKLPGGQKNERDDKAKIDRQWAKISQILSKRKENERDDKDAEPAKKMKY